MIAALLAVALAAAPASTDGGTREKLVVLSIKPLDDASKSHASVLSEAVLTDLGKHASVDVLGESDLGQLLGFERQKQMLGCADEGGSSCLAELGGALGARYLLTATLGKLGTTFRLDMKLLDTKESKAVGRDGTTIESEDQLLPATMKVLGSVTRSLRTGRMPAPVAGGAMTSQSGPAPQVPVAQVPVPPTPMTGVPGTPAVSAAPSASSASEGFDALRPPPAPEPDAAARRDLNQRCQRNDPDACFNLAVFQLHGGNGVRASCPMAATHFWRACELGMGQACAHLAGISAECRAPRAPKPLKLVRRACTLGWMRACEHLNARHLRAEGQGE